MAVLLVGTRVTTAAAKFIYSLHVAWIRLWKVIAALGVYFSGSVRPKSE